MQYWYRLKGKFYYELYLAVIENMGSAVGFDRPVSDYYKDKTNPYAGLSILEMQSLFYFIVYSLGICLVVNISEIISHYYFY